MSLVPTSSDVDEKRDTFFRFIYGDSEGYICIARLVRGTKTFEESFFEYPEELPAALEFINRYTLSHEMYYCPQIFGTRKRTKENVTICPNAWADLDGCHPDEVEQEPSIALATSHDRYQALWVFEEPLDPADAEDVSRRIAYAYEDKGADKSGWDLTQLLRVPLTYNHKYATNTSSPPTVRITKVYPKKYTLADFADLPQAHGYEYTDEPMPDAMSLKDPDLTLEEYRSNLHPHAYVLYTETPEEDWSKNLWSLQLLLYEAGMSKPEVFTVARHSACNKYARDGRSDKLLWKEVLRSWARSQQNAKGVAFVEGVKPLPPLLTDEEREWVHSTPTIVEDYISWAKDMGDAAWQYHQVGAFVILSTLLAGTVRLPTSYGTVFPNLWFMILADTTLTRKTTSMDMAMDVLLEVDADCILATDGSIEGLMTSLSMRPGKPSIFLRDEFSGLLESMTKKDYYAGMAETLTKLYDGKYQKRILRKETIEVRDPVLIFFAGGIKTRILQLLQYEHVASGFLPRFCFVTAESDITRLRPLGPPTDKSLGDRQKIIDRFTTISRHYKREVTTEVGGKVIVTNKEWNAKLTDAAWARYNVIENQMLQAGLDFPQKDLATPTFDRLSKSGLKASVLLAAARNQGEEVIVTEQDLIRAFYYIEQWRPYSLEVLSNIGLSTAERELDKVLRSIKRSPGVHRSVLMRNHHLTARDTDNILGTLEQRGVVTRTKDGKTEKLYPTEGA